MKKKLLTTVLTVGVVLSLVGCGAKETTSSESVAETTEITTEYGTEETTVEEVVEETTVAETEAEVVVVEESEDSIFMKEVLANFESKEYIAITLMDTTYDINNPDSSSSMTIHDVLFNWKDNVAATISEESGVTYYDFTNDMAYVSNEDMTGFYKSESPDVKDYYTTLYNSLLKFWVESDSNFIVEETTAASAGDFEATNQYNSVDEDKYYTVNVIIDSETKLPTMANVAEYISENEITLEDGTTVSGEGFKTSARIFNIEYLDEGSEDFATFQSATTLPADDECTLVEGETTTTE